MKKRALGHIKWVQHMRLFILDEGPTLLANEEEAPVAEDLIPERGIPIEMPGDLMVKMAPMLLICAKIFSAAAKIGTLAGLPIPLSIFGTTMQAAVEHAESYQNGMEQLVACNPDDMDGVNEIISYLNTRMDSNISDVKANMGKKRLDKMLKTNYKVIEKLLTTDQGEDRKEWADKR